MYSPRIQPRLIPALYRLRRAQNRPMTELAAQAIEELLLAEDFVPKQINASLPESQQRRLDGRQP